MKDVLAEAKKTLGPLALQASHEKDETVLVVPRERIAEVLKTLRDDPAVATIQLMDICGVDFPERPERFEVVYHLLSLKHNARLRVIVTTDENAPIPSVAHIHSAANWFEREVWDLFGIRFEGHPDLRRILTDYGFEGHPLRKDFPLTGRVELRYDIVERRIAYLPVNLEQECRDFDTLSRWKGMTDAMKRGGGA